MLYIQYYYIMLSQYICYTRIFGITCCITKKRKAIFIESLPVAITDMLFPAWGMFAILHSKLVSQQM